MPASAQFLRSYEREYDAHEPSAPVAYVGAAGRTLCSNPSNPLSKPAEIAPRICPRRQRRNASRAGPHFSRKPAHSRKSQTRIKLLERPRISRARRAATARAPMAAPAMQHRCAGRTAHRKTEMGMDEMGTDMATATASKMALMPMAPAACARPKPAAARKPAQRARDQRQASRQSPRRDLRQDLRRGPASRPASRRTPASRPAARPGNRKDARHRRALAPQAGPHRIRQKRGTERATDLPLPAGSECEEAWVRKRA